MENNHNNVTLVTCYYKIASKHPHFYYETWINNLLENVGCNIIIFTSADLESYFQYLAKQNKKLKMLDLQLKKPMKVEGEIRIGCTTGVLNDAIAESKKTKLDQK